MRAAGVRGFGLAVEPLDVPEPIGPSSGEVLIDVRAAGVANWDDLVRTGAWAVGGQPPLALGTEAAGVVAAVGVDVDGFAVGDRVLVHSTPLRYQGAWAERFLAPAADVAALPDALADDVAAALPIPALTADQTLRGGLDLTEGLTLLVHGAGGVTGRVMVQLAVELGAIVYATAGARSHEVVRAAGAADVVDYRDPDWPAQIRARSGGRGVDVAVNAAPVNAAPGGAGAALAAVRDGGRLVSITAGVPATERSIETSVVYVAPDGERLAHLAQLAAAGVIGVEIGRAYPLDAAADALAEVRQAAGRAIVVYP
jgi:NADPH:quinone reductase-like Zn-dependent oxidoreductase